MDTSAPSSGAYDPSYTTGASDAWKKSARKIPVATRMTKQYMAISPRKNAQLSGKMWRSSSRSRPLPPRLVCSQRPAGRSGDLRTPKALPSPRLRS